ncbi:hypothetical protein G7046_g8850 [Stylonectria norvegica]|nr:hypothetical protein G7046_g8850 [Stylonectria norvegica]
METLGSRSRALVVILTVVKRIADLYQEHSHMLSTRHIAPTSSITLAQTHTRANMGSAETTLPYTRPSIISPRAPCGIEGPSAASQSWASLEPTFSAGLPSLYPINHLRRWWPTSEDLGCTEISTASVCSGSEAASSYTYRLMSRLSMLSVMALRAIGTLDSARDSDSTNDSLHKAPLLINRIVKLVVSRLVHTYYSATREPAQAPKSVQFAGTA